MSVPIVVEASGDAEQMTIVVANHGNAIPEHALPTLFDLLTGGDTSNRSGTAARTGSRSRLPLHCQVHQGTIKAQLCYRGTRFTVRMPRSAVPS